MTGLQAEPISFGALAEAGLGLMLGGMVGTLTPLLSGLVFGHFDLWMSSVLVLGRLAGSTAMTHAMPAVRGLATSPVAVLGQAPTMPLAHIPLTIGGTVIVEVIAKTRR